MERQLRARERFECEGVDIKTRREKSVSGAVEMQLDRLARVSRTGIEREARPSAHGVNVLIRNAIEGFEHRADAAADPYM